MREILFRGKRKKTGEWIKGMPLEWHDSEGMWITQKQKPIKGGGRTHEVIPETVGQYTGLTDKNGTKIFEGDIVEIVGEAKEMITEKEQIFVVEWQDEDCGFNLFCWFDYVVIGNIHDNPELLKEERE